MIQFLINSEKPRDAAMRNTGTGFVVLLHHSLFDWLVRSLLCSLAFVRLHLTTGCNVRCVVGAGRRRCMRLTETAPYECFVFGHFHIEWQACSCCFRLEKSRTRLFELGLKLYVG